MFEVIIVGAGLGGLACAIGLRREGLKVLLVEKDKGLSEFGAGIALQPNAARVMHSYGLLETLIQDGGAFQPECVYMRRWDGELLTKRPERRAHWLGFDLYVRRVDCNPERPTIELESGEVLRADVVVGADGLFSGVRTSVLGKKIDPEETGDIAWRATLTEEDIKGTTNTNLLRVTREKESLAWLGPSSHVAFYPLRGGETYNLVLIRPDDLPSDIIRQDGDLGDLREFFKTWDPMLNAALSQVNKVAKWKLHHIRCLDTWVNGAVALLGDAAHPTLPYQAQGAAMAVEDGATLARLLSLLSRYTQDKGFSDVEKSENICRVLQLYQSIRKERGEFVIRGAEAAGHFLHLPSGPESEERDRLLRSWDWNDLNAKSDWQFFDPSFARQLLGFDAERESDAAFMQAFRTC